uniref:Uncharacterized protein n=1 Tax=Arundo donax TaxID=35708 RepID=A0A0A8Y0B0_ARUDO
MGSKVEERNLGVENNNYKMKTCLINTDETRLLMSLTKPT